MTFPVQSDLTCPVLPSLSIDAFTRALRSLRYLRYVDACLLQRQDTTERGWTRVNAGLKNDCWVN